MGEAGARSRADERLTIGAVKICDAEHIRCAALRSVVRLASAGIRLAADNVRWHRDGGGRGCEGGDDGGEVHDGGVGVLS
jgi:hypothetical protein